MIATVTLNPSLDLFAVPERFETGRINRCAGCSYRPGGKGVNVSLLLSSLGADTAALGFAAGFTGREITRLLAEAGCRTDLLPLSGGCSRINVKIRDGNGTETDLNGTGPEIPREAFSQLEERLASLKAGDALVLAGSVPPSLGSDAYARLLSRAGQGVLTVVDAAGDALLRALPLRPFLIKPNLEELEELSGRKISGTGDALECARALRKKGARNVAVSLGEKGALLLWEDGRKLFCPAPRGRAVSTVGAGDSLVAGFLYGWSLEKTPEAALSWGVAAGSATAFSQGIASGDQVKALRGKIGNICYL